MALFEQNHIVTKRVQNVLVTLGINSEIILNILTEATAKTVSEIAIKAGAATTVITAVETVTGALVNNASKVVKGASKEGVAGLKAWLRKLLQLSLLESVQFLLLWMPLI